MRNSLSILVVSIALTACGSDSSSESDPLPDPANQDTAIEYSELLCGSNLASSVAGDLLISSVNSKYAFKTVDNGIALDISGTSNTVCITGNLIKLTSSGTSLTAYISGNVGEIDVTGTDSKIYVWGDAGPVEFSGATNTLYAKSVGAVTDSGVNNQRKPISEFTTAAD